MRVSHNLTDDPIPPKALEVVEKAMGNARHPHWPGLWGAKSTRSRDVAGLRLSEQIRVCKNEADGAVRQFA